MGLRWRGLGDVADDVAVERIEVQSSIVGPSILGRMRLRSTPTNGEPRNGAGMPPFLCGSAPIFRCNEARTSRGLRAVVSQLSGHGGDQLAVCDRLQRLKPRHSALVEGLAIFLERACLKVAAH